MFIIITSRYNVKSSLLIIFPILFLYFAINSNIKPTIANGIEIIAASKRKQKTITICAFLYEIGGTELVGNLKGLWRFKRSEFKKYRIIGHLEDDQFIITVLAVEGRSDSCKNKEDLAKKARKNE